jgi:hypothetical protein
MLFNNGFNTVAAMNAASPIFLPASQVMNRFAYRAERKIPFLIKRSPTERA